MIEIKDLLSKFNKLLSNKEIQISLIQETLKEILSLDVSKDKIKIINNDIFLEIKPIYKNEIFINKDKILKSLEEKALKNKNIKFN